MKKIFFSVFFVLFLVYGIFSCAYSDKNNKFSKATNNNLDTIRIDTIWISAVGDLMCHGAQLDDARKSDGSYDFNHMFFLIKPIISNVDLAFGNFETVLAGADKKFTGYPTFNSPDEFAQAIKEAGFDVLTTANNHCLDRGFQGLSRTIDILEELGFYRTGTFATEEESNQILIINVKDIRLAVLAYTYGTNGINPPSGKQFSVAYINTSKMKEDIVGAKKLGVDKVIVCIHWGEEYQRYPNTMQKKIATELFEAGADIIFGSHPHVIQPMEVKTVIDENGKQKKVFIIYSMGNFISNQRKRYTDSGVIVRLRLIKNKNTGETIIDKIDYIPTYVSVKSGNFKILPVFNAIKAIEKKETDSKYYFSSDYNRLKEVWNETTSHLTNEEYNIFPLEEEFK
ncbi:MAG: CapA family protein [Ignavibacteria bacterium]|nr:CapA family protein [Ignavibacteria bacterium]